MNEYVNVENVFHILDLVMSDDNIKHKGKAIRKRLKELPAEEVEKVVRCKDCKKCDIRYPLKEIGKEAVIGYFCEMLNIYKSPTDFCSYGVRKEGAEG